LKEDPTFFQQKLLFYSVDLLKLGKRTKDLDIINNAKGYVFYTIAEKKEGINLFATARLLYEEAMQNFKKALRSSPNDIALLRNYAQANFCLFRLDIKSQKLEEQKKERERMNEGKEGKYKESADTKSSDKIDYKNKYLMIADTYYRKAIEVDHSDTTNYYYYANFLVEIKKYDMAEDSYLECLLLDPNHVETLNEYAKLLKIQKLDKQGVLIQKRSANLALRASRANTHKDDDD